MPKTLHTQGFLNPSRHLKVNLLCQGEQTHALYKIIGKDICLSNGLLSLSSTMGQDVLNGLTSKPVLNDTSSGLDNVLATAAATPKTPSWKIELSESYTQQILEAYHALAALSPFDTHGKVDKAAHWWSILYDVLAFTSIDSVTESLVNGPLTRWRSQIANRNQILNNDRILSCRASLRRVFGDCEIALEEMWADRIEASSSTSEGCTSQGFGTERR